MVLGDTRPGLCHSSQHGRQREHPRLRAATPSQASRNTVVQDNVSPAWTLGRLRPESSITTSAKPGHVQGRFGGRGGYMPTSGSRQGRRHRRQDIGLNDRAPAPAPTPAAAPGRHHRRPTRTSRRAPPARRTTTRRLSPSPRPRRTRSSSAAWTRGLGRLHQPVDDERPERRRALRRRSARPTWRATPTPRPRPARSRSVPHRRPTRRRPTPASRRARPARRPTTRRRSPSPRRRRTRSSSAASIRPPGPIAPARGRPRPSAPAPLGVRPRH